MKTPQVSSRHRGRRSDQLLLVCIIASLSTGALSARDSAPTQQQPDAHATTTKLDLDDPTDYFRTNSLHVKYSKQITFDQYTAYAMRSLALVAGFDNDLHRYDNQLDLINSFERNLTYGDDLSSMRAHIDSSESELLAQASELTLIENEHNQQTCARQLDFILEESLKLFRDYESYTQSKRLDLLDYLDSFGAAPSEQILMGNTLWFGSFEQCRRTKIDPTTGAHSEASPRRRPPRPIEGRYCVAHLRLPSWGRAKATDKISLGSESIKLGVCLPRACNSISVLRHSARIESLIRLARLQQVPYSSARLTQLFCLPDESSPLRQLSGSARAFIGLLACWLLLVAYYSLKYEVLRARRTLGRLPPGTDILDSKLIQVFAFRYAWRKLFEYPMEQQQQQQRQQQQFKENLKISASCCSGATKQQVVGGSSSSSSVIMKIQPGSSESGESGLDSDSGQLSSSSDEHEGQAPSRCSVRSFTEQEVRPAPKVLNLAVIDGLKVISMMWLVSAHTLLFFVRNISNGSQFWSILLDARFMTIMMGIFPVDSFFTITGVLTAYLKFSKSSESRRSLRTLGYWLEAFLHRYLRFMPMYLLVFWYTRDVSEYIGMGPMWDYATASTSLRSICKRESVWAPLLFQANFKPLEMHCVKPAWYLANDYQFLLITPLFTLALLLSKWFGYLVISVSVLASLAVQFMTVYWPNTSSLAAQGQPEAASAPQFTDFEAIINFRPMFATYLLKDLWRLYVLPYNRIPPYLIGLLTGHLMYCYNTKRLQQQQQVSARQSAAASSTESLVHAHHHNHQHQHHHQRQHHHHPHLHQNVEDEAQKHAAGATRQDGAQATRKEPSLFIAFVRHYVNCGIWTPVALLISIVYSPFLTTMLEEKRGELAHIGASLMVALMRFIWSLAVARLIYVCYTTTSATQPESSSRGSFIISLLSHQSWKPWSKIGLSVLLIQWEVIGYLAQSQAGPPQMSFSYMLAYVIVCNAVSYALGLFVYLLFEFPMAQIAHLYVSAKIFPRKTKKSR